MFQRLSSKLRNILANSRAADRRLAAAQAHAWDVLARVERERSLQNGRH